MKQFTFLLILSFHVYEANAVVDLDSLYNVGDVHVGNRQFSQASTVFKYGLNLAKARNDHKNEANFLIGLGLTEHEQNNLESALEYYEKARTIASRHSDTDELATTYLNTGIIYKQQGANEKALIELLTVANIFQQKNNLDKLASTFNTIGNIFKSMHNFKMSLGYHRRALNIRLQLKSIADNFDLPEIILDISSSYHNIGDLFKTFHHHDSAIFYLNKAISYKKLAGSTRYGNSLTLIGEVYHELKNTRLALQYIQSGYQLKKQTGDYVGIAYAGNVLARFYMEKGAFQSAEKILDEVRKIAEKEQLRSDLIENYDTSRKLYRKLNKKEKALFYDDRYIALKDSAHNSIELYKTMVNDAQENLRNQDRLIFERDKELADTQQAFLLSGIALLVIIVIITMLGYYQKKKGKEKIETLLRELNHRVKNNMQVLSNLLNLHHDQVKDENSKRTLKETGTRVNAMGMIHRKLYHGDTLTMVSIDHFIREITDELSFSYGFSNKNLSSILELDPVKLPADKAVPLGLIINELLTNTFKYAFTGHPSPKLIIKLKQQQKHIKITIHDNGPGIPDQNVQAESFGLKLIRLLTSQLNGKLNITNDQGMCASLII